MLWIESFASGSEVDPRKKQKNHGHPLKNGKGRTIGLLRYQLALKCRESASEEEAALTEETVPL